MMKESPHGIETHFMRLEKKNICILMRITWSKNLLRKNRLNQLKRIS